MGDSHKASVGEQVPSQQTETPLPRAKGKEKKKTDNGRKYLGVYCCLWAEDALQSQELC